MPIRTCIGCLKRFPQSDLQRFGLDGDGLPSQTVKIGRSAYLCGNPDCLEMAIRKRRLDRAFRRTVAEGGYERLRALALCELR